MSEPANNPKARDGDCRTFSPDDLLPAQSSFAAPAGSARTSVRLKVSDWKALINFVGGDLANMPEDDENKQQMNRILDAIRLACVKASNKQIGQ